MKPLDKFNTSGGFSNSGMRNVECEAALQSVAMRDVVVLLISCDIGAPTLAAGVDRNPNAIFPERNRNETIVQRDGCIRL